MLQVQFCRQMVACSSSKDRLPGKICIIKGISSLSICYRTSQYEEIASSWGKKPIVEDLTVIVAFFSLLSHSLNIPPDQ